MSRLSVFKGIHAPQSQPANDIAKDKDRRRTRMDVKQFVEASLRQIIEGVIAAQEGDNGKNVNAALSFVPDGSAGNLIHSGTYGTFTRVDFDIGVSAESETKGGGKGGVDLKVVSLGIGGEGIRKTGSESRLRFSVPVRLPDGDQSREEESRRGYVGLSGGGGSWSA